MLLNIVLAAVLMMLTTGIHAGGMLLALQGLRERKSDDRPLSRWVKTYLISRVVLVMFLVSLAEVLLWACTYLFLGAIEGLEKAVYFSMVTFTTLGYGDVVLDERWRLISSFEAANGIILFGWTTAIVVAVVNRIYFRGGVVQ
jgi:hypothetical protein